MFQIHLNAIWIVKAIKSATFSATESAPKNIYKTTCFMLFLKKLD